MTDSRSTRSADAQREETREERKAQSRRRILESAREVFFRDGFIAANLDEVWLVPAIPPSKQLSWLSRKQALSGSSEAAS